PSHRQSLATSMISFLPNIFIRSGRIRAQIVEANCFANRRVLPFMRIAGIVGTRKSEGDHMLDIQQQMLIEQRISNMKPSTGVAYLLAIFLGVFGAHRFYLKRTGSAVA